MDQHLPPVIRMVNDIAMNLEHKPHDEAVEAIAAHLNLFWAPRMRRELVATADAHRGDLDEIVLDVLPHVHVPSPTP